MVNMQKFSFLTLAARFKFWNLFLLFLLILRHFQKVLKTFLGCYIVWYEMFTTALRWLWFQLARSKHDIFYFFGEKTPASVVKVLAAILNPQ